MAETDKIPPKDQTPELDDDEAAAGKMWAVYVAEAENYDRGLIEGWKSDMEGMLIFAGLFSASLVAFLIESYKTLAPDSGDTTVLLLTQISNQLAAAANGTPFTIVPHTTFTPQTSSLVCNILWFISLGLSLTCALLATLVEQWAREFMHKAEMRSAPVIRARVVSYLYYGLKRFKMHTVVEIIPLLLHTSLLFFFVGLVAFLIPVNFAIVVVTGILLGILAAVYVLLTVLPLVYRDCPYRTPLSGAFWQLTHDMPRLFWRLLDKPILHGNTGEDVEAQPTPNPSETMVEVMFRTVKDQPKLERLRREQNALVWTMKSLADDGKLERFIEAIPDVLWSPTGRRSKYDEHIQCLIESKDPHVKLLDRIETLYQSCDTGLLTSDVSTRRRVSCYQATWAVGTLTTRKESYDHTLFRIIATHAQRDHYALSAAAISRWRLFCAAKSLLDKTVGHLDACNLAIAGAPGHSDRIVSEQSLLKCLQRLKSYSISLHYSDDVDKLSSRIERLMEEIGNPSSTVPFRILMDYLTEASSLPSPPFRFEATRKCIAPPKNVPLTKRWFSDLESRLKRVVDEHLEQMNTREDSHWLDSIVHIMISYWVPPETNDSGGSLALPQSFIQYLNRRTSEAAVKDAMNALQIGRMGNSFPATILRLTGALSQKGPDSQSTEAEEALSALWPILRGVDRVDLFLLEAIIKEVSRIDYPLMTPSVIAMAKYRALILLGDDQYCQKHSISRSSHPLLPVETVAIHLSAEAALTYRLYEGRLGILTEFIHACHQSGEELSKARETLDILGAFIPGNAFDLHSQIHPTHQLGFARAVQRLFEVSNANRDDWRLKVLDGIPHLRLFAAYSPPPQTHAFATVYVPPQKWLTSPDAHRILKQTVWKYLRTLLPREDEVFFRFVEHIAISLGEDLSATSDQLDLPLTHEYDVSIEGSHTVGGGYEEIATGNISGQPSTAGLLGRPPLFAQDLPYRDIFQPGTGSEGANRMTWSAQGTPQSEPQGVEEDEDQDSPMNSPVIHHPYDDWIASRSHNTDMPATEETSRVHRQSTGSSSGTFTIAIVPPSPTLANSVEESVDRENDMLLGEDGLVLLPLGPQE